jgi:hypothetical protein
MRVGQRLHRNESEEKQDKTKREVEIKEVNIKIKVHEYTSLDIILDPNENKPTFAIISTRCVPSFFLVGAVAMEPR